VFKPDPAQRRACGVGNELLADPIAYRDRQPGRLELVVGHRYGVVEEHHEPVAREMLERPAVPRHKLACHDVIVADDADELLRLGGFGERSEKEDRGRGLGLEAPRPDYAAIVRGIAETDERRREGRVRRKP
jgi:hypothetical protein